MAFKIGVNTIFLAYILIAEHLFLQKRPFSQTKAGHFLTQICFNIIISLN